MKKYLLATLLGSTILLTGCQAPTSKIVYDCTVISDTQLSAYTEALNTCLATKPTKLTKVSNCYKSNVAAFCKPTLFTSPEKKNNYE